MSARRVLAALCVLGALSCKGGGVVPRVDLAERLAVERDFADLRDKWEGSSWETVIAMAPALDAQLGRHDADPSSRAVRAMRAVVAVEQGDLPRARQLVNQLLALPGEGSTRDAASVVLGSLEARAGRPQRALEVLSAHYNRIIDPPTRAFLNRELVQAALGSRKFTEAARFLRALVRQSGGPLRPFAEREASSLLTKLPGRAALDLLRAEVGSKEPDRWLAQALADHLAGAVASSQDPQLARDLLEVAAPLLGKGTDDVARVAAKGAGIRLERNTVGLLMPLRTDDLRRRGIEAASGLALALGIPGGTTKLIVRDDQRDVGKIEETLALLNADGAAVIVAGFDTREADLALGYAEKTGVPLVLFRPPSRPFASDGPVFVLGESPTELRAALALALGARGKKRVALLSEERVKADLPPEAAALIVAEQPCGAALDFVKAAAADALIVDGGQACAASVLDGVSVSLPLAFGLEASAKRVPRGLSSSAGLFPLAKAPAGDALFSAYLKREGKDPSWWVALGHDAGVVVRDAVLGLPSEDDAASAAVAVRKRIVTEAIARAEGSLWTTEAKGFAGGRAIKRTIEVSDVKKK